MSGGSSVISEGYVYGGDGEFFYITVFQFVPYLINTTNLFINP